MAQIGRYEILNEVGRGAMGVVFEDSTAGIEAALRSGATCIALTTTHSRAELDAGYRVLAVPDFRSLSVATLQKLSPAVSPRAVLPEPHGVAGIPNGSNSSGGD